MDIASGAGHDANYLTRVCPTGMIFVPCKGGISHNETESATPADLAAGTRLLAAYMVERRRVPAARSAEVALSVRSEEHRSELQSLMRNSYAGMRSTKNKIYIITQRRNMRVQPKKS